MNQDKLKQRVADMDEKEMRSILRELLDTKYYAAILKYLTKRLEILNHTIWSVNILESPEKATQAQGYRSGLLDLSNFAEMAADQKKQKEKEDGELDPEERVNGTAVEVINAFVASKPRSVVEGVEEDESN